MSFESMETINRLKDYLRPLMIYAAYRPAIIKNTSFVPEYFFPTSCCVVFKGEYKGEDSIAKIVPQRNDLARDMLGRERDILMKLSGLEGIPRFLGYSSGIPSGTFSCLTNFLRYGKISRDVLNILYKTFLSGQTLSSWSDIDSENQIIIEEVVRQVHKTGHSGLDFGLDNIVIGPDGRAYVVDLGVYSDCNSPDHEKMKKLDLLRLESFFKPKPITTF